MDFICINNSSYFNICFANIFTEYEMSDIAILPVWQSDIG